MALRLFIHWAVKAFSYLRVSGKGQVDGDGFDRQRDVIAKRCKAAKIEVVREFMEEGISGTSDLDARPALSALFEAVMANGVRTIIVERSDRFSRDLMVGEVLLAQFRDIGVTVIEAEDGRDLTANDPDNATGTLVRQILAVIAQFEKTSIVAKLRKARARQRVETGRCEGRKPFGSNPGEEKTLTRMRELRRKPVKAKRLSFAKIAAALDAEGCASRTGKPWSAASVKQILAR
jgi:DNA invertase Pin-like site-specific DNA recombinase